MRLSRGVLTSPSKPVGHTFPVHHEDDTVSTSARTTKATDEEYINEFGCTEKEIRLSNTAISAHGETIDDVDQYTAIKMADKIADKAATYAGNALNSARRAMRPRRRDKFNADYRLLKDAADRADTLLERLEHEREAAQSDQEPIQDTRSTEYEASSDKHHVEAA